MQNVDKDRKDLVTIVRHEDKSTRERSTCGWRYRLISEGDENNVAWVHVVDIDGAKRHEAVLRAAGVGGVCRREAFLPDQVSRRFGATHGASLVEMSGHLADLALDELAQRVYRKELAVFWDYVLQISR